MTLKRALLLIGGLFLTLFMAACGMDNTMTTTGTTASNTTQTMTTPTTMANNDNNTMMGNGTPAAKPTAQPMMNATPTPAAMGKTNNNGNMNNGNMNNNGNMTPANNGMGNTMTVNTRQVNINGKMVMVLTTSQGMVLYYRMSDPAPNSGCTGACAKEWPPFLSHGMTINSSAMLPKKLTVHTTANGDQIEYDGHPLYTYAGDMAAGQFNGRGMGNVWYLVGVAL